MWVIFINVILEFRMKLKYSLVLEIFYDIIIGMKGLIRGRMVKYLLLVETAITPVLQQSQHYHP